MTVPLSTYIETIRREANCRPAEMRLVAEIDRLTLALHARCGHPDFEYDVTTCERKAGPAAPPEGEGWVQVDWHRHEYHESYTWARPRTR